MIASPLEGMSTVLAIHSLGQGLLFLLYLCFVPAIIFNFAESGLKVLIIILSKLSYYFLMAVTISYAVMGFYAENVACGYYCDEMQAIASLKWFFGLAPIVLLILKHYLSQAVERVFYQHHATEQ